MTDIVEAELREYTRSVKKSDFGESVLHFWLWPGITVTQPLPATLPADAKGRQATLLSTLLHESMWASAVYIAISKIASLGWDVESDVPLRRKRAQQWMLHAGAGTQFGWGPFLQKHLQSYLCSPFAVVEIERESRAYGSRIRTIHHLDPTRCTLTHDPERPVVFTDLKGREHVMMWWQVGVFSDMPDPTDDAAGGICAAQRAYSAIKKLAAIEQYVYEKVSGQRSLALDFIQGIAPRQVEDALTSARADATARGLMSYMGATVIPSMSDIPMNHVRIPLAELPDGFDRKEEWDLSLLTYANAIGLDPQDLQPLTGQPLGTGAQSQVLDNKAKGRGLAMWRSDFAHWLNELTLDDRSTFTFSEEDLRDERERAQNRLLRAQARAAQIESGEITPEMALNMAVDDGDVPKEFLPDDATLTGSLEDDEKPEAEEAARDEAEDAGLTEAEDEDE